MKVYKKAGAKASAEKDEMTVAGGDIYRIILLILCALAVAFVPAYWIFADAPALIALEKRYRTEWPEFSVGYLMSGKWGERADAWMTDKIPAREVLVGIDAYTWYFMGRQSAQEVYVDKNGNLVEAPPLYTEAGLGKRVDKILDFAETYAELCGPGASIALTVPPNAGYAARLPDYMSRCYKDAEISRYIAARINARKPENYKLTYVDMASAFGILDTPLYYRTDHHWNGDGAYAAYAALGGALGYEPLAAGAFRTERAEKFYGATYVKSGLWLTAPDALDMWTPPVAARVSVLDASKAPDIRDTMFFTEYLDDMDKYSVFLGGIHGLTIIENLDYAENADAAAGQIDESTAALTDAANGVNPSNADSQSLIIVKDSFANSLIPLLLPHYKTIVAVDLRYYRGETSKLCLEYTADGRPPGVLIIYSMYHIANDPDLLWLR